MKQRERYLQLVLLSVVVILGVLGCLAFLKFRNSVKVSPSKEYSVDEQVVLYRQENEEWADDKLGESKYSMAGSGCLVSCIASAISGEGNVITPGELNAVFSENNVYDADGNIQWGQISAVEGYQVEVFETPSNDCIEECLKDGKYPIVRVRMSGVGNFHYVLIVGAKEDVYICMEPLEDELTALSKYGNRIYAVRCVWKE